jgi:RNA 2',3'-cyclic 3'-phosphodiesterase
METWRCFVAVPVPSVLRANLQAAVDLWRSEPEAPDLRWTDPTGWHLTLAFLGWVAADAVPGIERAMADAARAGQPGQVESGGLGVFPAPRRARVLWYGVSDPSGLLGNLATSMRDRLIPLVPGLAAESSFRGHVTLARARAERGIDLSGWLSTRVAPAGTVPVDEVILYRSHLGGPGPARYEALESSPVGRAGKVGGRAAAEASIHG